jgi:ArsR family transcriptional regulator, arsenate/arsenite/antimonite-responsive transcriptional repressor
VSKYRNIPKQLPGSFTLKDLVTIASALSDLNRVRALLALRQGELCVCRIIELLNLAPSTVSKHMQILKQAGLVDSRKEERWIYYHIVTDCCNSTINGALDWLFTSVKNDVLYEQDSKLLLSICAQTPESLCKKRQKRQTSKQKAGSQ